MLQTLLSDLTATLHSLAGDPIPNPDPQPPPGSESILRMVSIIKWLAGAAIIATFFGGITAFTAGRIFDHHRSGRAGMVMLFVAVFGAIAYAVAYPLLSSFATTGG